MSSKENQIFRISEYLESEDDIENLKTLPSKVFVPSRQSVVSKISLEVFLKNLEKSEKKFLPRNLNHILKQGNNKRDLSIFEKIRNFLHSQFFYTVQIVLVVFDIICVLLQIICDILLKDENGVLKKQSFELINGTHVEILIYSNDFPKNQLNDRLHLTEYIAEISSAVILGLVICLAVLKMIFECKYFFKSKLELFDIIIVTISFALELTSLTSKKMVKEIEASSVIFRFWRVIRIVNGL